MSSPRERTALVTGASSGIGFETALGLARAAFRVGLVGRDAARTAAAAGRVQRETGARADVFVADLSTQSEVRRLGREVAARYPVLDRLVNNAGALFTDHRLTADGIERTWALDHLAYVLLTEELMDPLRAAGAARIVNVASRAHARGRIDVADPDGARGYRPVKAYAQAKLGNVLFTGALARRLADTGITVNAVHPGVVASGFAGEAGGVVGLGWRLIRPFLITPERGARTSLHVALAPELAGVTGRYFARSRETPSSPLSRDTALQERVWALSRRQLGLTV